MQTITDTGDRLPVLAAIADPQQMVIGLTIQKDYPLGMIHREFGVPFARFKIDNTAESDPFLLHACKSSVDVHIAEFGVNAFNDRFIRDRKQARVHSALSTGVGNLLQNKRSVAYLGQERRLFHVPTEQVDGLPPYACLTLSDAQNMAIQLLQFSPDNKCLCVEKARFFSKHRGEALSRRTETTPKWAVSGYPLILSGQKLPTTDIMHHISDWRHLWQLPKLDKTLNEGFSKAISKPLEFFFGFDRLGDLHYSLAAASGDILEFELGMITDDTWCDTVSEVCQATNAQLDEIFGGKERAFLRFDDAALQVDFQTAGNERVSSKDEIARPGQFAINRNRLFVKLLPGIYPHHIVGILEDNRLLNMSITGESGRNGITLDGAKELCKEVGLVDALIFDNGFDVVAQIGGINGVVIRHLENTRHTRLTAALHFGRYMGAEDDQLCGYSSGLELGYAAINLMPGAPHEVSKTRASPE